MDTIQQHQLTLLDTGGNQKLLDFLTFYDLSYEPIQRRYHTVAADFYRQKLKELAEKGGNTTFDFTRCPDKPSYDDGRKPLIGAPRPSIEVLG